MGEKRPRACGSKKVVADEQRMKEMERRLELLGTVHDQGVCSDEKLQKALSLHDEAEEVNKQLRGALVEKRLKRCF